MSNNYYILWHFHLCTVRFFGFCMLLNFLAFLLHYVPGYVIYTSYVTLDIISFSLLLCYFIITLLSYPIPHIHMSSFGPINRQLWHSIILHINEISD